MENKKNKIFKRLALASMMALGYGLFYSQFNTRLIRDLSQKKEFVTGIDFEAYHKENLLNLEIQKSGEEERDVKNLSMTNWYYPPTPLVVVRWMEESFSDTLGYSPYYSYPEDGDIPDSTNRDVGTNKNVGKNKGLDGIMLKQADSYLKNIISFIEHNHLLLKIRKDKEDYKVFHQEDPLTYFAKRVATFISDVSEKATIELEVPADKDYAAHENRVKIIKEINPNLKVATSLDKNNGYDEQTGIWNPEKSRDYWKNSDIIILNDYFSAPSELEKSIKIFKKASDYKKEVWIRVIAGSKRINEKKVKNLEQDLEDYTQSMKVAKEYADGCLTDDSNGIWFYSDPPYDNKERLNKMKELFKKFRGIKLDKS